MERHQIEKINDYLQKELNKRDIFEVKAIDAALWLQDAELLKDSADRPGLPLRRMLRQGKIKGAIQRNARYWYIQKEKC